MLNMFFKTYVPALPLVLLVSGAAAALPDRTATRTSRTGRVAFTRVFVFSLAAVAVAVSVTHFVQQWPAAVRVPDAAAFQRYSRQWVIVPETPVSAESRAVQAHSWLYHGGDDLMDRFYLLRRDLFNSVNATINAGGTIVDLDPARAQCTEIGRFAQDANQYFRVPDMELQKSWNELVRLSWDASKACERSLDTDDSDLFNLSMQAFAKVQDAANTLENRLADRIPAEWD